MAFALFFYCVSIELNANIVQEIGFVPVTSSPDCNLHNVIGFTGILTVERSDAKWTALISFPTEMAQRTQHLFSSFEKKNQRPYTSVKVVQMTCILTFRDNRNYCS